MSETHPTTPNDSPSTLTPEERRAARAARKAERRRRRLAGELEVHEPHKVGIPPLGAYFKGLWERRQFAMEMSRTDVRVQHLNTVLGGLWLVLNPIFLAFVYFFLVAILRGGARGPEFLAHLVACLFVFHGIVHASINHGAKSVVSGGKLILNSAFPRALLPLSSVITAVKRFLPAIPIYLIVHAATGVPFSLSMLWVVPIFAMFLLMSAGLALAAAAVQVYLRDLRSFLPYALRLWLYASPIIWFAHDVPDQYRALLYVNPAAPMLTAWNDAIIEGHAPGLDVMLAGLAWAVGIFLAGALFFISREREFAVRL
jgi:teichoic acid transport system permease protein